MLMFCVDYEEFKPKSYKGIYVHGTDEEGSKSYTGDIIKDYDNVSKWFHENHNNESAAISSSFDNFFMDSKEYTYRMNRKHQMVGVKKVNKAKK